MSLGDAFSDAFKKQHFNKSIDFGSAILVEIPSFDIKYKKFAIYVANDFVIPDNCGIVVINSEINKNVNNNPYLKSQHIVIDVARHPFLAYDSFVDCSQIHNVVKKAMVDAVVKDPKLLVGNVHTSIMQSIHNMLVKSKTISKADKEKYKLI